MHYFNLTDTEAAALIEGYARRVPRAMLWEICEYGFNSEDHSEISRELEIRKIAAKHSVVIE
jgi:hypothetical protein